ncbi:hypothetical protein PYCC9005_000625 [Savitreella phatthalungensis]
MVAWTAEQDRKILLFLIRDCKATDFAKMAEAVGDDCTPRAVQEHIKKLKKLASEADAKKTGNGSSPSAPKKRNATQTGLPSASVTNEGSPTKRGRKQLQKLKLEEGSDDEASVVDDSD